LRYDIPLWLDEKGNTHRRMLWKKVIKAFRVIKVYPIAQVRTTEERR
jgi:hypothetical protein